MFDCDQSEPAKVEIEWRGSNGYSGDWKIELHYPVDKCTYSITKYTEQTFGTEDEAKLAAEQALLELVGQRKVCKLLEDILELWSVTEKPVVFRAKMENLIDSFK